jgi:hypothetical protein
MQDESGHLDSYKHFLAGAMAWVTEAVHPRDLFEGVKIQLQQQQGLVKACWQ